MTLDTVLVAVGSTEQDRLDTVASAVVDVAGPADASVVLGHAFTDQEFDDAVSSLDYHEGESPPPDEVTGRLTTVRELERAARDAGLSVDVRGVRGGRGEKIVELAEEIDADLVFVGGRKRSPTGKALFGSTAQEILLNAPCPVTFVRG